MMIEWPAFTWASRRAFHASIIGRSSGAISAAAYAQPAINLRIARGTLVPAVIDNREQGARADAAALGRNIVQPRGRHEVEQRRRRDEMTFVEQVRRKRSPEIELPGANLNSRRDRCTPFGGLGQQSWILV